MTEWQPIETAPRDGTEILVAMSKPYEVHQASFDPYAGDMFPWITPHRRWVARIVTHWMPLPEPPKAEP